MAKHETEMHRQKRELLEGLKQAAAALAVIARHADNTEARDRKSFALGAFNAARAVINSVEPPLDRGLFADHRQLDLADRKDC